MLRSTIWTVIALCPVKNMAHSDHLAGVECRYYIFQTCHLSSPRDNQFSYAILPRLNGPNQLWFCPPWYKGRWASSWDRDLLVPHFLSVWVFLNRLSDLPEIPVLLSSHWPFKSQGPSAKPGLLIILSAGSLGEQARILTQKDWWAWSHKGRADLPHVICNQGLFVR